jgi:hypothetical protein
MVDPQETDAPKLAHEIDSVVKSEMDAKNGAGKVTVEAVNASAGVPQGQPAPHSPEAKANPGDIPAEAPSQLNESASSTSGEAASSTSSAPNAKDGPKDASSSRKVKKKHHLRVPIPF